MHQERGAAAALDECADRGSSGSDDQITLPVPWNGAVLGLDGVFAEDDIGSDIPLRFIA